MDLFGHHGYHAVSTRDIANALGQNPSALYFHISSKQELLFELTLISHRAHLKALREALMDAGADPVDQLRGVVTAHVRRHIDYPSVARLTNRELGALTPDQLDTVLALRRDMEQVIIDVLDRGNRLGAFSTTDTYLDAKAIGAMGIRLPEWFGPDSPRTKEQIVERYVTYALKLVT